jgi:hypothetical protein
MFLFWFSSVIGFIWIDVVDDLEAIESQMMVAVIQPTVKPGVCPSLGVPSLLKILGENCSDDCMTDGECPHA